jgi:hypothetical protein
MVHIGGVSSGLRFFAKNSPLRAKYSAPRAKNADVSTFLCKDFSKTASNFDLKFETQIPLNEPEVL